MADTAIATRLVADDHDNETEVFRAALERLLPQVDPGGFLSNELGVAWVAPDTDA